MKILIIDDKKSPLGIFKNENIDFDPTLDEILLTKNALDGIEALRKNKIDLCLIDFHLNDGFDGSFVIEFLKNNSEFLPTVTFSISADLIERNNMDEQLKEIYKTENKPNSLIKLFENLNRN